jgi:hypothetical protein
MKEKNWPMCPYVNFDEGNPEKGWVAFYDPPRYSSGYATLFETIAYVPETHMLKPFSDRVRSTYAFMQTVLEQAAIHADDIIQKRSASIKNIEQQITFPLNWKADTTQFEWIDFKGYETGTKMSEVTGMPRTFYDHSKPFEKKVKFYNTYVPTVTAEKPVAYIVPQGWHEVITRLRVNAVAMRRFEEDTTVEVEYYHIDDYKSLARPYEKHHFNYDIKLSTKSDTIHFFKGDYLVYTGQRSDRYIVETLEPLGDDSFFKWNFFDEILQQKEGYSNYRWEDVAARYLQQNPGLKRQLEEKKRSDTSFAASADAQLDFVYKHSPYYEPANMRYPVYRLVK